NVERGANERGTIPHAAHVADSKTAAKKFPPAPKELTRARRGCAFSGKGPSGSARARQAATICPPPAAAISPIASLTEIFGGTARPNISDRTSFSPRSISTTPLAEGQQRWIPDASARAAASPPGIAPRIAAGWGAERAA